MAAPSVPVAYLGAKNVADMKRRLILPENIAALPNSYELVFETGAELTVMGSPLARVWIVGRARREGDADFMSEELVDRLASAPT